MTDIAAATPLKLTVYPQSYGDSQAGASTNSHGAPDNPNYWGEGGFSFKSFLDLVNPLQHIPVVSTIYQSMTGDIPSSGSNIVGGLLYGGPVGLISSIANEISKTESGQTIGQNLLALAQGKSTITAQNDAGGEPYLSPNQRASYNAYVRTQQMMA